MERHDEASLASPGRPRIPAVPGVVLILGEERFLAREALVDLLAGHPDLEVERYTGSETSAAAVLDLVRTPSLLAAGRAVVVVDAGPLLEGEALDAITAYAARPVAGSLLVLQASKLDGRLKAAKALKKHAKGIECAPLSPYRELPAWIGTRAREAYGLQVGAPAADALRGRIGDDLGLLDSALLRLRDQIAPRTRLEPDDVIQSTREQRSPVLFEAGNALESRDLDAALCAVDAAFRDGVRIKHDLVTDARGIAPILLSSMHRVYVKLLRFQMALQEGVPDADAAQKVGVSPRAARFFVQRAKRHRLEDLVARHERFAEADLALKTSRDEPRRILEHLLLGLLG